MLNNLFPAFEGITPASAVGFKYAFDLITHLSKYFQDFFVAAGGMGGINESPMVTVHLPGKDRTGLVGIAANGDDRFHGER